MGIQINYEYAKIIRNSTTSSTSIDLFNSGSLTMSTTATITHELTMNQITAISAVALVISILIVVFLFGLIIYKCKKSRPSPQTHPLAVSNPEPSHIVDMNSVTTTTFSQPSTSEILSLSSVAPPKPIPAFRKKDA